MHHIKWCRTLDLKSGQILEDRAFDEFMLDDNRPLGNEATDIQTIVYYGKRDTKATSRMKARKGLLKSIATCAAVFLLEASVFTSVASQSSTALSQRYYGTSEADVWQIGSSNAMVTEVAHRQGWRCLKPVVYTNHERKEILEYVMSTNQLRNPRLTVIEAPSSMYRNASDLMLPPRNKNHVK